MKTSKRSKFITFRNPLQILILLVFLMGCTENPYKNLPKYQNPDLSVDERVDDLISRMTLEEKISQLRYDAPAIERLGIAEYNWWNECLHGVARSGRATVFPQAIGLAAMWDKDQMFKVATAISDEARAKYHDYLRRNKHGIYQGLTFWTPNINIFRDPRWGRGMETYGEDPYLTGQLGIRFVKGLQGDNPKYLKTVSTVKHFAVHSGPEPERHSFDARVSDRDLFETYLPHFRDCIIEGKAQSVMCAYNLYLGMPCCGNSYLLDEVLRKSWGFDGYVVSDCWALTDFYNFQKTAKNSAEAGAIAIKAGTDLNCGVVYRDLQQSIDSGFIKENKVDLSLKRLLKARFQLGMFDPSQIVEYSKIPIEVNDCAKHRKLALETAQKSIVLLKNKNNFLPLKKDIKTIAVIGPNSDDLEVLLGNYNGTPTDPITPLRGIREKLDKNTSVIYAHGCDWADGMPKLFQVPAAQLSHLENGKEVAGLVGEYFDNNEMKGNPVITKSVEIVSFNFWDKAPVEGINDDDFAVKWTGLLTAPETGKYLLGCFGNGYRIFLGDSLLKEYENRHEPIQRYVEVQLIKGKKYSLRVDAFNKYGDCQIDFRWKIPGKYYRKEALEAAQKADVVVMVMGLSPRLEGEEMDVPVEGFKGGDRTTLELPALQEELLKAIYQVNQKIVLVLINGSALSINWADQNLPAIVEAWYPGQAGGAAIADVLFGDFNPSGRLPITFYKSVNDLPPFGDYNMKGHTYRYFEGEVLYPFGFGLSYSTFEYSNLEIPEDADTGDSIQVTVKVKNTGKMAGEEVAQLYLKNLTFQNWSPIISLKGFERIFLDPGEEKMLVFALNPRDFSIINEASKRVIEPAEFIISVGGNQSGNADQVKQKSSIVVSTKIVINGKQVTMDMQNFISVLLVNQIINEFP